MYSFQNLVKLFAERFQKKHFPPQPSTLYNAADYFLQLDGKRVRPILCLMANELFDAIHPAAWDAASAIELFHNFTLIHDDIMDKAPLRRGVPTVHVQHGESTAILSGDVMLIQAYEYLNKIPQQHLHVILQLFNTTAKQVCEGQQIDMDFEKCNNVVLKEYVEMITLKTSVLLACSLQIGAILGRANEKNQQHVYEFGKSVGIAFQIQDDYLDAFGDPEKFGKQIGGDIVTNKKTFLWIHALEVATPAQHKTLQQLIVENPADKVAQVLSIFKDCKVEVWAKALKQQYFDIALQHLEAVDVLDERKQHLKALTEYLIQREG